MSDDERTQMTQHMNQHSFLINCRLEVLPTSRHTITKLLASQFIVSGLFPDAPADLQKVAVLSGCDVYRSGSLFFIDPRSADGTLKRVEVSQVRPGYRCSTEISSMLPQLLLTTVMKDGRPLFECGPIVANRTLAYAVFTLMEGEHRSHNMTQSQTVGPWVENMEFIVDDPIPFSIFDPVYDIGEFAYSNNGVAMSIARHPDPRKWSAALSQAFALGGRRGADSLIEAAGRPRNNLLNSPPVPPGGNSERIFHICHPDSAMRFKGRTGPADHAFEIKAFYDPASAQPAWVASDAPVPRLESAEVYGAAEEQESFSL